MDLPAQRIETQAPCPMHEQGEFVIGRVNGDGSPDEGEIARVIERREARDGRQIGAVGCGEHGQNSPREGNAAVRRGDAGDRRMKGLDRRERPATVIGVRNGLGFLEGFFARADRLGEPILIELGRLRLPPARRNVFRRDRDRLDAGFGDGERRGRRAQRLEADLMKGVGEQPAFEIDAVFGGALSTLQFFERDFRAIDENFVVDDGSVERADELD